MSVESSEVWRVLYTMPNAECKVKDRLLDQGFIVFLPLCKTVRQWSDRKKRILVPLFPNYIFIKSDLKEKHKVLRTQGVVKFLGRGDTLDVVPHSQIELIEGILSHNPDVSNDGLLPGDSVIIVDGPFKGMQAVLSTVHGRFRLSLRIESINKVVMIDVPAAWVEKYSEMDFAMRPSNVPHPIFNKAQPSRLKSNSNARPHLAV